MADKLISQSKAVSIINRMVELPTETRAKVIAAINRAEEAEKWIPVTERLPEVATTHNTRWDKSTDSIRVLCACVQADGKKMVKEGYCKVYSDGTIHWKIPGTIHSVTHWMPLPEPPKGG